MKCGRIVADSFGEPDAHTLPGARVMSELKVTRFDRSAIEGGGITLFMFYECSEPGNLSGDYVPLADVRALEARAGRLEGALRAIQANRRPDPGTGASRDFGNGDDVFNDGVALGEYYGLSLAADLAAEALAPGIASPEV